MEFLSIEFLWPLAFLILPLPFLYRYLMKPARLSAGGSLRVPFFRRIASGAGSERRYSITKPWRLVVASLIWGLLVTALARPVLVGDEIPIPVEGRDLMMAIDLSGSMGREDFAINGRQTTRLAVVKTAADDFIERREGDRVGLILFSNRAYLQAPLTFDRDVVRSLLDEAQVGLTGQETAIGDAIAVALKRLKDRPTQSRVLVLLTDGASNAGVMQPLQAAALARDYGIRIYTIGVGAGEMVMQTAFGQQLVNPSQDLDEATLKQIADMTGGLYFRAQDLQSLAGIYAELDRLEPVSGEPMFVRPSVSLFYLPLGAALVLTGLFMLLLLPSGARTRSIPAHRLKPSIDSGALS
jgi:Ca-activated chloride channel homolog